MATRDAYHVALDLLARREHTRTELLQKLSRKNFPETEIEAALARLQEQRLQSDERFVEAFTRYRRNQGYGPLSIKQSLVAKGVADDLIEAYIDLDDADWLLILQTAFKKKFGVKMATDAKSKAKYLRFLQYRGFTLPQIMQVIKEEA